MLPPERERDGVCQAVAVSRRLERQQCPYLVSYLGAELRVRVAGSKGKEEGLRPAQYFGVLSVEISEAGNYCF